MKKVSLIIVGIFFLIGLAFWIGRESYQVKTSSESSVSKLEARSIASTSQDNMLGEINRMIIEINNPAQINKVIDTIVATAAEPKNKDLAAIQLYALLLQPLKHFEGIVWRLRPIVEESDLAHMTILTLIRSVYYRKDVVGPHIRALVQYITEPNVKINPLKKVSDVQDFLANEVAPDLERSLVKATELANSQSNELNFEIDQYLFTGYSKEEGLKFISDNNRYKMFIPANMYFVKAGLERILGAIYYSSVYDLNGGVFFLNKLIKETNINRYLGRYFDRLNPFSNDKYSAYRLGKLPPLITPKEVNEFLKDSIFQSLLTPRKDVKNPQEVMNSAFSKFQNASQSELNAFNATLTGADRSKGDSYFVNPIKLLITENKTRHKLEERVRLFTSTVGNPINVVSDITGKSFQINVSALFTVKKDLKKFYPSNFYNVPPGHYIPAANQPEGKTWSWNYLYGRPNAWPDPTFSGLFPDATNENMYELMRSVTITPSTAPFSSFVPVPGIGNIVSAFN